MARTRREIDYEKWRAQKLRSGDRAPMSGQYRRSDGVEITVTKGERMPPTPEDGMSFQLVDPTGGKR